MLKVKKKLMLRLKVNNLADVIGHSNKLEEMNLEEELNRLNKQERRTRLVTERLKVDFQIKLDKKHKNWWDTDKFVRDNFQIDFEGLLGKRLQERIKSEQLNLKQQSLSKVHKEFNEKENKKKKKKLHGYSAPNNPYLKESELLLEKIKDKEIKFPELKNKLIEQYQRKAQRNKSSKTLLKPLNAASKDSKLFMECAERFLNNKPYNVENHEKLNFEENLNKFKEKAFEKEKVTKDKCEKKFGKIISAFEKDKKQANGYYDDYDSSSTDDSNNY